MVFWSVMPYALLIGGYNISEKCTASIFYTECGSDMFLQNSGNHLNSYLVNYPEEGFSENCSSCSHGSHLKTMVICVLHVRTNIMLLHWAPSFNISGHPHITYSYTSRKVWCSTRGCLGLWSRILNFQRDQIIERGQLTWSLYQVMVNAC